MDPCPIDVRCYEAYSPLFNHASGEWQRCSKHIHHHLFTGLRSFKHIHHSLTTGMVSVRDVVRVIHHCLITSLVSDRDGSGFHNCLVTGLVSGRNVATLKEITTLVLSSD